MGVRTWLALLLIGLCCMAGCQKTAAAEQPAQDQEPLEEIQESESPMAPIQGEFQVIEPGSLYKGPIEIALPEASGTITYEGNGITIDASHTENGYIMVKSQGADTRLKTRVYLGEDFYTYDLRTDGEYEVYPLQMGNGSYEVRVYQQVEGTNYSPIYNAEMKVEMPDTDRVFLYPSQYVWYTNDKNAVKLSYDLCMDLGTDQEKAERIYNYIVKYLTYDDEKAATVQKGYLPDVDVTLAERKGICFDYSALMASMLRAQEIPVRLVIGYVQPENLYHAWNQVYVDGEWVWMDATFGPASSHKEEDYTQEREY